MEYETIIGGVVVAGLTYITKKVGDGMVLSRKKLDQLVIDSVIADERQNALEGRLDRLEAGIDKLDSKIDNILLRLPIPHGGKK